MPYLALIVWGGACALQDASQRRIANGLTLSCIALSLVYLLNTGESIHGGSPSQAIAAVLIVLLLMLPGYITGRVGAGDIKMLLGLALASEVLYVLMCIISAGVTIGVWAWAGPGVWTCVPVKLRKCFPYLAPHAEGRMPYAPFLFVGMLFTSGWRYLIPA